MTGASPNTVYLRDDARAVGHDGGIAVVRVFDLVDRHFPFDYARVSPAAAGGQQFAQDFRGDRAGRVCEGVRGKNPGGWRWCAERPAVNG